MAKESKDVARSTELIPNAYRALSVPATQLTGFLLQNLGAQGLKPTDLDRIKVPAGGGITWEVPSLKGIDTFPVIEGIILHFKDVRAYWKSKKSSNSPPDCSSPDTLIGIGSPGGVCAKCPLSQFGTAIDEHGNPAKGQACKQMRLFLFLRQEDMIPLLVAMPPTSIQPAKKYFLRLVANGYPFYGVTTQLRLEKAKNAGGTVYSVVSFAMGRQLEKEEFEKVQLIAQAMKQLFEGVTVDADAHVHE